MTMLRSVLDQTVRPTNLLSISGQEIAWLKSRARGGAWNQDGCEQPHELGSQLHGRGFEFAIGYQIADRYL